MSEKIILTEDLCFGKGWHKKAYFHPDDETKCIKVPFTDDDIDVKRELFYRKILAMKGEKKAFLVDYFGEVETTAGKGYCFELVRDFDGKVSQTMDAYIRSYDGSEESKKELLYVLHKFKKQFLSERLITSDVDPGNFMVRREKDGDLTIKIIDNIGSPVKIPLIYFSNLMQKRRARKYWIRLLGRLNRFIPETMTDEFFRENDLYL